MLLRNNVAACAKHFVGDGGTHKGINENDTLVDFSGLLRIHMPAYYDSIKMGVSTVMLSFSSWKGVKMHAHRFLVTDFLKKKLGFKVDHKRVHKYFFIHCLRIYHDSMCFKLLSGIRDLRLDGHR